VFLARLESGLLLFETPQGLVPVELSFSQRVYLLWTFRNFRQLSLPLLNPRQGALVNALAQNAPVGVSNSYDPSLVIGLVEDFVMPPPTTNFPPATTEEQPEQPEQNVKQEPEIAIESRRDRSSASRFARLRSVTSRFAAAAGTLVLCIMSLVAWHRIKAVPDSHAQDRPQPQQISLAVVPNPAPVADPPAMSETPIAVPPPIAIAPPVVPEAAIKPTSETVAALNPRPAIRRHDAPSIPNISSPTSNISPSPEDRGVPVTRPPLRFVYPTYSGVRARGVVALTAEVDPQGSVRTVRVVSGNRALVAAAVKAVRQWRYRPYLKNGESVVTETNVVISFFSDGAISMTYPPNLPLAR
jgi:TonB family protein